MADKAKWKERWLALKRLRIWLLSIWLVLVFVSGFVEGAGYIIINPLYHRISFLSLAAGLVVGVFERIARKKAGHRWIFGLKEEPETDRPIWKDRWLRIRKFRIWLIPFWAGVGALDLALRLLYAQGYVSTAPNLSVFWGNVLFLSLIVGIFELRARNKADEPRMYIFGAPHSLAAKKG